MIIINGKKYQGNNLVIRNNQVFIDGVEQKNAPAEGILKVEITGHPTNVTSDVSISVNGNVLCDVDAGGSVQCGAVGGSVDAGGSVQCGAVGKNVDAGGSVTCGDVEGNIDAGGSVMKR